MKRITKKILLLASAFSSVMNMNGCGAYGPPPDEQMQHPKGEQVSLEAEQVEENAETEPVSTPEPKYFSASENINPCVYGPPPGH